MKKLILSASIGALLFTACKSGGSNPSEFVGKWEAESIEAPTEDSLAEVQTKAFMSQIDAMTSVEPAMAKEFGTKNLDSVKKQMKARINEQKEQMAKGRKEAAEQFKIELHANGYATQKNDKDEVDSATWYTATSNNKQILFLDPVALDKPGTLMGFFVEKKEGDKLKLRVHQSPEARTYINLKKAK